MVFEDGCDDGWERYQQWMLQGEGSRHWGGVRYALDLIR